MGGRAAAHCGRRRSGGNPGTQTPTMAMATAAGWPRGVWRSCTRGVQGPPLARGRRCDSNAHAVRGMHTAGPAGARAAHAAGPGHRRRGGGGSPLVSDTNPTRTRPEDTKRARQRDNPRSRAARRDNTGCPDRRPKPQPRDDPPSGSTGRQLHLRQPRNLMHALQRKRPGQPQRRPPHTSRENLRSEHRNAHAPRQRSRK